MPRATPPYLKAAVRPGTIAAAARQKRRKAGAQGKHMKHYGIAQWVDFCRGLLPTNDAAAMQAHAAVCEECRDAAAYFSKLARFCRGLKSDEVPEPVVRNAQSVFPVKASRKRSFRIPLELIYD